MPQIRAVMSGASRNERPRSSASKKRGGSKMPQLDVLDPPVLEPDGHRPLALDPREVVGADRAALSHRSRRLAERLGVRVEGLEDALDVGSLSPSSRAAG